MVVWLYVLTLQQTDNLSRVYTGSHPMTNGTGFSQSWSIPYYKKIIIHSGKPLLHLGVKEIKDKKTTFLWVHTDRLTAFDHQLLNSPQFWVVWLKVNDAIMQVAEYEDTRSCFIQHFFFFKLFITSSLILTEWLQTLSSKSDPETSTGQLNVLVKLDRNWHCFLLLWDK